MSTPFVIERLIQLVPIKKKNKKQQQKQKQKQKTLQSLRPTFKVIIDSFETNLNLIMLIMD